MESRAAAAPHRITRLGEIARLCLRPGRSGAVLAAFSKAVYLQADTGEVFWLITKGSPMHRRAAEVSDRLPRCSARETFSVDGERIAWRDGGALSLGKAETWSEPAREACASRTATRLAQGVPTFLRSLNMSEARGFGCFIPELVGFAQTGRYLRSPKYGDGILGYARPLVREVAAACLLRRPDRVRELFSSMIGLGSGLTPSGDDFLGGLLFTLKTLGEANPALNRFARALAISKHLGGTHIISWTLLHDMAEGHAIAPLHEILSRLMSGESVGGIHAHVLELTGLGYSSGWDLLAGVVTGLLAACGSDERRVAAWREAAVAA